jgi:tRNA(Phe) wybutosine-synthesizing methylase Tyw3
MCYCIVIDLSYIMYNDSWRRNKSKNLKKYHENDCYMDIVQDVWMKGIQNKISVSQKAFIIHIYGLHHYKGKLSKFFSQ